MTATLAVTGWEVLSPYGFGASAFGSGVLEGRSALRPATAESGLPQTSVGSIDTFDVRAHLGRKGTRSMDRATGMAVATVGMLVDRYRGTESDLAGHDTALVLGTTTGSAKSMMDFTHDSLVQNKPYHVDPARFPNTVMNCAAGQCAIWHKLTGPNTTIAGGRATVLSALSYATRLQRSGHATTVLCGAVEELSERRAWLEWHSRQSDSPDVAAIGEACAIFMLEPVGQAHRLGRSPHALILGQTFINRGPDEPVSSVVADVVRRCLDRARVQPSDVTMLAAEQHDGTVRERFGWAEDRPRRITVRGLVGDTGAVSAGMQLGAVLAQNEQSQDGRVALIVADDPDGGIAAVAVRLRSSGSELIGDDYDG